MSKIPKAQESLSDIWKLKQRGKRDSERHKKLVNDAIRKNGKDLITEHNIITSDGDKKIKVPIRFLDRYKFKYGKLNNGSGTGQGLDVKKGDKYKLKSGQKKKKGEGDKAGDKEGEISYEAEVTIDELVDILMDELNLPWMEPNKSSFIEIEHEELSSIERKGIYPNLDLKKTLIENIKRNAAKGEAKVGGINEHDLRYKNWEVRKEYISNAAIYLMMDVSGSMTQDKVFIAKSFYFWMVQFLKRRYKNIDLVFIAHDTKAHETTEKQFFAAGGGGGTKCSSAFKLAYETIQERHPAESWNNYVFEFSDGDNWFDDNLVVLEYVQKLLPLVRAMGYGEITLNDSYMWPREDQRLSSMLEDNVKRTRFVSMKLTSKDDVFDALKLFFNIDGRASNKSGKSII
jgi:sporulation protein YhbH